MNSTRLFSALFLASLLPAQQATPCGPYLVSSTAETELTPAAFGAAVIDDLCLAPDPNVPGGYFGFVILPGTGAQAFRWTPGSAPVVTSTPGVLSASAVIGISIGPVPDANGKLTVVSTRPFFFPGFFETFIAKVTPDATATASDEVSLGNGLGGATPSLGRLGGTDVLIGHPSNQSVTFYDVDIDAASAGYGATSNQRAENLSIGLYVHESVAIRGQSGESRSLLIAQDGNIFVNTTPKVWFRDVVEDSTMPTVGATLSEVLTSTIVNLRIDWIAQIDPSTFLVQYAGNAPLRLQVVSTSSTPAPIGQTSTFDVRMPSDRGNDFEFCFAAMTLAGTAAPAPIAGPILGNLCLSQTALVASGVMAQNTGFGTFSITPPNGPFWVGVVLSIQGFGFEAGSPNGYFGNAASVEIVN